MPPKASFSLPDGTKIEFDGTVEELQSLTASIHARSTAAPAPAAPANSARTFTPAPAPAEGDIPPDAEPDIARIVGLIKDCDEAELIDSKVLAKRDALNRVLMCLWVVQKYVHPMLGLTSGDVERITDQLGVKVAISHASTTLSDRAKAFVTGDAVRKQGAPVRYRLNRRGMAAFEEVLNG